MGKVLALDTANSWGSLALWQGDGLVAQRLLHAPDGFGHVLFGEVETLLHQAGWQMSQVERIAVANGPGSFTGIRVALAAAKGLAFALDKPLCGVTNLAALRHLAELAQPTDGIPVLPAGRGEFYATVSEAGDVLLTPEALAALTGLLVVPEAGILPEALRDRPMVEVGWAMAGAVAELAAGAQAHGPALLDAHYVRRSDAEMKWRDG